VKLEVATVILILFKRVPYYEIRVPTVRFIIIKRLPYYVIRGYHCKLILLKRVPYREIRGFHTLSDKDFTAVLCDAAPRGALIPKFRKNIVPSSTGSGSLT